MERYLSSLSLFDISQCYALFAPERTSVMRKVHALERQDLIEEMRISCMASDITRLPTLPQLMGPPSPHDCTVAYIELGSAPLCVLLGVSTEQKDRWLLQNETSSQHACIHLGVLNTVGKSDVGTQIEKVVCTNSLGCHNALKAIVSQWPMLTQQDNKT
ncbi:hypothetical protein FG05_30139 [Fusarium graminearum]|nr:hypothetical protein FG05_30139 [Fusarium graminearum]